MLEAKSEQGVRSRRLSNTCGCVATCDDMEGAKRGEKGSGRGRRATLQTQFKTAFQRSMLEVQCYANDDGLSAKFIAN